MRSSLDKRRDMARSILPSRRRSSAARFAAVKRANRRAVAQRLAVANGVPADWDDELDDTDPCAYPDAAIGVLVGERRSADKLNHFERWAVRVTRDLPIEDRLGVLRAGLPRGLVGEHAVSHLRALPEISPDVPWWMVRLVALRARALEQAVRAAERRRRLLLAALEQPGAHRRLNRAMKAAAEGDPPVWRTLAGWHDVDAFLADVAARASWQAALDRALAGLVAPPR